MATIIPALSTISRMTRGERRVGRRLESLLEEDYLAWYDIPLGQRRRYPDFIILHPARGLLFLEVKDWKIDALRSITPDSVEIDTPQGRKSVSNPLTQARQCAFAAIDQLKRDTQLTQTMNATKESFAFPTGMAWFSQHHSLTVGPGHYRGGTGTPTTGTSPGLQGRDAFHY